ncbi:SDR family NAD(P)-dependent oxidoreductase [Salinispira pacifica]
MTTKQLFTLTGRVAVVTGGSAGLGWDIACSLAEAGAAVIITSRTLERAADAADRLGSLYGVDATGAELDQRDYSSVIHMRESATAWKGQVDILVNNAGGGSGASGGDLFSRPVDLIREMVETNLLGVLYCCREIGRHMRDRRTGRILNIASIAGEVGRDRRIYAENGVNEQPVEYAASKAGVAGLTRDLAAKLAPYGVTVNAVSPGGFDKGTLPPGFVQSYAEKTALGRMGELESDIKGVALLLCSDASGYITGQNYVVDGGFTTWK